MGSAFGTVRTWPILFNVFLVDLDPAGGTNFDNIDIILEGIPLIVASVGMRVRE